MALNDSVLAANGYAWDKPGNVTLWTNEHREQRDAIVSEIKSRCQYVFGFKDPRTLLTLPFWEEAISPVFIATFRHPLNVSCSLLRRSGMAISAGLSLWHEYNRRLLTIVQDRGIPLVDFDLGDDDYVLDVRGKIRSLGLGLLDDDGTLDFFESGLRSQSCVGADIYDLPPEVAQVYAGLKAYHSSS
jgi:hypothetical protein